MAGPARAQVAEEAGTDALQVIRKGVDKKLDAINVDLRRQMASDVSERRYGLVERSASARA